jgi:hypothetical protein
MFTYFLNKKFTLMKTTFLIIALLISCSCYSQSSLGLVAHWDMNGSANDVSGNGHNGHLNNVVPTTGKDGLPNTAYYFNGVNSSITAGYLPDLNLTQFSICAIVKVAGFYRGSCHGNTIFTRGAISLPGNYSLYFYDVPFTGDCSILDTTKDVFVPSAGGHTMPASAWAYTPTTVENIWYKVIATWDGTTWQIFVNDTLKASNVSTGGTFGTSTDSICIGWNVFSAYAGYPYNFTGVIDDIRLYNRVLSDSEAVHYGDSCGRISLQPVSSTTTVGSNTTFTVTTTTPHATFQWQQDAGTGFVNLSNSGIYSGVNTNNLTLTGVISTVNANHYRCLISNSWFCNDTSTSSLLSVRSLGIGGLNNSDQIIIYPNPSNHNITIEFPDNGFGNIQLENEMGQVLVQRQIKNKSEDIDLNTVPAGIYIIRINYNDNITYKKVTKY